MQKPILSSEKAAPKVIPNEIAPSPTIIDGEAKRLIELYKYSLKHHYDPPIHLGSKWDDFVEKITRSPDFLGLPDKSLGRYYFDKYQKYLAKKSTVLPVDVKLGGELVKNNEDDVEEGELVS